MTVKLAFDWHFAPILANHVFLVMIVGDLQADMDRQTDRHSGFLKLVITYI